jgi:hypothetical protein
VATIDSSDLANLRDSRFPELPLDCGNNIEPGIVDTAEWRDWSEVETTADQLRIEDYLDLFDLSESAILHIGIGNSGLALRFAAKAKSIFGTSVVDSEVERANSLNLPNYRAVIHNKHSDDDERIPSNFDFIVDNNPTTFCCCMKHLAKMLELYAQRLTPGGQMVTDRVGLSWTTDAPRSNERWSFSFDDLAAVAALAGLTASRLGPTIYTLSIGRPKRPGFIARARYEAYSYLRRIGRRIRRSVVSLWP